MNEPVPAVRLAPRAPLSDEDLRTLAEGLRLGRDKARMEVYDRFAPTLRALLIRLLGADDPDRGDLLHEVFVQAFAHAGKLQTPEALAGWLTQIAVFTARQHIRRRRRWRFIFADRRRNEDEPADVPDPGWADAAEREAVRAVYRILDRFAADERLAFCLRHMEGMELEEAARTSGLSLSTFRRRLAKAEERFAALSAQHEALAEWRLP